MDFVGVEICSIFFFNSMLRFDEGVLVLAYESIILISVSIRVRRAEGGQGQNTQCSYGFFMKRIMATGATQRG